MKIIYTLIVVGLFSYCSPEDSSNSFKIQGLNNEVEIIVDEYGISHIYASNEEDLFFAQGFNAARDRLFQLEVWRRQASGTVAEILGERELKRDIGTRLFKFRGDIKEEMAHYHSNGVSIIESYTKGINAFITETERNPELLPPEFGILGLKPGKWTPDIVISRHQGLLGNIGTELTIGRAVAALGSDEVHRIMSFTPENPDLSIDPSITSEMLRKDILGLYNAYRRKVTFLENDRPIDIAGAFDDPESIGSNNWIVSGEKSESGYPMMANDPHRTQAIPSLRYWVHLTAPGWDVIGGGEPEIPGISIGHNGFGAWGLTVFATDAEDLYVYDLNPENLNQYRYKGEWVDMETIEEEIPVKDRLPEKVTLRYTRHGPVTYIDSVLHKGYAVRCGWLEVGGSPYLASLRMDQAQSWEEFREACSFSHIPGENMIWADKDGNIGWQAVGIAPVRENWSGLVPIPGDGTYEWNGYLPIKEKPNMSNPDNGYFGTANQYVTPNGYPHMNAIGFIWSDPFRGNRINQVLERASSFTIGEMIDLQTDYYSEPAHQWVPFLSLVNFKKDMESYKDLLLKWDYVLGPESVEAAIYATWERELSKKIKSIFIPESTLPYLSYMSMTKVLDAFSAFSSEQQTAIINNTFVIAIERMKSIYGEDDSHWKYGQSDFKHISLQHPLSPLLTDEERTKFDTKPIPRGGNSYTLNNTSGNNKQTHGASFRIIVDTGDFSKTVGANSPGQSGDPRSDHYKDLYESWGSDEFFPVHYTRDSVMKYKDLVIRLNNK